MLAGIFSLPVVLLFLGECGEYELLFTVRPENEKEFLQKARKKKFKFFNIGTITESSLKMLKEKDRNIDLTTLAIRARDYHSTQEYIDALVRWLDKGMVKNGT